MMKIPKIISLILSLLLVSRNVSGECDTSKLFLFQQDNFEIIQPTNDKTISCTHYIFPYTSAQAVFLAFKDTDLNCDQANIQVRDNNQVIQYDFCNPKTDILPEYIITKSNYLTLTTTGAIKTSFDVLFVNLNDFCGSDNKQTSTTSAMTTSSPPPPPPPLNCGVPAITPNDPTARIINGNEAIKNSWPWMVLLQDGSTACGGSIINNNWVLTAAHCAMNLNTMYGYVAEHDDRVQDGEIKIKITKFIGHPQYNKDTLLNDIALLKLETPVTYSDKISPICLAPKTFDLSLGRYGMVTGWGTTKNTAVEGPLRQTSIKIQDKTICGSDLVDSQICAGILAGPNQLVQDSCQGDSGGPFVIKENGRYQQVGVVSYGDTNCSGKGVYTNVASYLDWIDQTIKAN